MRLRRMFGSSYDSFSSHRLGAPRFPRSSRVKPFEIEGIDSKRALFRASFQLFLSTRVQDARASPNPKSDAARWSCRRPIGSLLTCRRPRLPMASRVVCDCSRSFHSLHPTCGRRPTGFSSLMFSSTLPDPGGLPYLREMTSRAGRSRLASPVRFCGGGAGEFEGVAGRFCAPRRDSSAFFFSPLVFFSGPPCPSCDKTIARSGALRTFSLLLR